MSLALPSHSLERVLSLYTARCMAGSGSGLEAILPARSTLFYAYGRQALAEALRRSGVGRNDVVLLPGFLCEEVLASLAFVGATPRFYGIDERLQPDPDAFRDADPTGVRAVLAVNYFGFPQPLGAMREWCRAHDAALIEDNAHGFLSAEGSTPLGRRGDLGVFSLRKTLSLPNGAALVDNRQDGLECGALSFHAPCAAADRRYRVKIPVKRLIGLTGLRGARAVLGAITGLRSRLGATPESVSDAETAMPQESCSSLTTRLLRRADLANERDRRRALYTTCRELFAGVPDVRPLFNSLPDGVVPQGFPFLYTGKDAESMTGEWRRVGVPIVSWPGRLPSAIRMQAPDHYRRVMVVPFLW
jgi:hypothetical protein